MKLNFLLLLLTSLASGASIAQERITPAGSDEQRPPNIVAIKFSLLNSPGMMDAQTRWETSYELRIASEATYYEALRQGKLKNADTQERVGELIASGSFARDSFRELKNRNIVLQLPLTKEIQERLKGQPQDRINLRAAPTVENIRLSKEDEKKAQVFLFYSIATFYDAKLKKNVVVPVTGIWMFGKYPKAEFEIKLEITDAGYHTEST